MTSAVQSSSHYRWVTLGLLLVISMVTYIDRVNVSIAGRYIRKSYGLSSMKMGKIFSAFIFVFALFQIPSGWLAERAGPCRLLTFAILWWSLFTTVTALAGTLFTARLLGILGFFIFIHFLLRRERPHLVGREKLQPFGLHCSVERVEKYIRDL